MPLDRTWYNTLVDDDGSGLTGSVWDKADVNALMNTVDAMSVACAVSYAGGYTIPVSGLLTPIGFTTKDYDPLNMYNPGGFYITVPSTGLWLVTATIRWAPGPLGHRNCTPLSYPSAGWLYTPTYCLGHGGVPPHNQLVQPIFLGAGASVQIGVGTDIPCPLGACQFSLSRLT
jgi:hypothetical protein